MCGGSPSAPPPPPKVPEAPRMPEGTKSTTATDLDRRRRRAASGQSKGGTILTGAQGVQNDGTIAMKTLLGQ